MVPASVEERFQLSTPSVRAISHAVKETVFSYCERQGFAYLGRTKEINSTWEKLESGRFRRWTDIDDLFGCTIIVPTLGHEKPVLDFLGGAFEQVKLKTRAATFKAPDVFRFEATRFVGRLRYDPDIAAFESLLFEVQVRTAFEHAWSVTTHALTYKNDVVEWRRLRLAAQLKASVEQLDLLVAGFDSASENITPRNWHNVVAKSAIVTYFHARFVSGTLPPEVRPKDLGRFAENLLAIMAPAQRERDGWRSAFEALTNHLDAIPTDMVPKSLSLMQFVVSEGFVAGLVKPSDRITLPVTREVLNLFPKMRGWTPVFDLSG